MANNFIRVAQNAKQILQELAGKAFPCPQCADRCFSPFEKLFIKAFGVCSTCFMDNPANGTEAKADAVDNIFKIIDTL